MADEAESILEDLSVASSVPTDLSISEISDLKLDLGKKSLKSKKLQQKERDRIAKQLLEKKQLEHDLQLVRIELNQKECLLENVRTEYKVRLEELEEKLQQCRHQKQILQAKTESQLNIQQDEAKRKQEKLQADLSVIKVKLRELETVNENLIQKSGDIKKQLSEHVDINEDKYYELRSTADDLLTVKDLIAMRVYEALRPYKIEIDEVKSRCKRLETNLTESEERADTFKRELDEERQHHAAAQVKLSKISTQAHELEAKANNKDYRINNYDRINQERDELERQLKDVKERNAILEREFADVDKARKHYEQEYNATKSALTLMTQDKDYMTRQVCELSNKLAYAEERLQRANSELDELKRSREELFEKYVSSRDQYKAQYEQQLQTELRQMSASTQEEVEKLRSTIKSMYEMESRTLKESRDIALAERDKAIALEQDLQARYHQLNDTYRQDKANLETKISEISSEMKLAEFERSRSQLLQEETSKNLKDCQLENEKMLKRLEVANKEYYSLEMQFTRRISDLESRNKEYQIRLTAYENIEKELDEVIMQAAEVDTDEGAEKVMLSYGYGASIPSSSQRRMKQSVHLARRCLNLERQMVSDKRQIKELEEVIKELKSELQIANNKLNTAEQPYSYILNKTQQLEDQVKNLKSLNHSLETELKTVSKKYHNAATDVKRLTQDLEISSRHGQEIGHMKNQLENMLSKAALDTKSRLMSEMSHKERLLRAKRLIEHGTPTGLHQAEDLLQPMNLELNPATQVMRKEMSAYEAVLYIDSLIHKYGSPVRTQQATSRPIGKSRSQPARPQNHLDTPNYDTENQPAPFSMQRRRVKKP